MADDEEEIVIERDDDDYRDPEDICEEGEEVEETDE